MEEFEKKLEKLRNSPVNELTIKDVKLLSSYLTTQIKMDELTKKDKKFLQNYLITQGINEQFTCKDCGENYDMAPIQDIDLCIMCISQKGIQLPENPLDRSWNNAVKYIIYAFVFLFFWNYISTLWSLL
jgi:hypothetical protein